ncbi:MAG: hypothetical protein JXQ73_22045 [Phycisphaerae bacterium]|nr:hypothetical protein [Phycisphaerae bacterium]
MTTDVLEYRFLFDAEMPCDAEDFWVLLFHEVLYEAPRAVNFGGWFVDGSEVYGWLRSASESLKAERGRPLTWPRMTVARSESGWTVTVEGHEPVTGSFELGELLGMARDA